MAGQADISQAGSTLTVHQHSHRAIINWQDFSIGAVDLTRFVQPSATSAVLNRVTGSNLSTLDGTLSANLLPSEQLPVGGRRSVRGYEEHALIGSDEGWTIQNELRTPPVSLAGWLAERSGREGPPRWRDQLQFLVFYDYGQARPDDRAAGRTTLASVGGGVRYTVGMQVSLQADYGHRLRDLPGDDDDGRWHLSAMLAW